MSLFFFSVRERAEFDKSYRKSYGLVLGRSGRNFPSGPLTAGRIVLLWRAESLWTIFVNDLAVIVHSLPFYTSIDEQTTQIYLYTLLRWFPSKRTHHRFPMKLGMLMLHDKEILKT